MTPMNMCVKKNANGIVFSICDTDAKVFSKLVGRTGYNLTVMYKNSESKVYPFTITSDGRDSEVGNGALDVSKTDISWLGRGKSINSAAGVT